MEPTYPKIISHTPTNDELGVEVDATIEVDFSIDIDEDTLNENTFLVVADNDKYISGKLTYQNQTAYFSPDEPLIYATTYTVTLKGSLNEDADVIRDVVGQPLPEDYTFDFTTTEHAPLLTPTILNPNHQTIVNQVEIDWTEIEDASNYDVEICADKRFENIVYATNATSPPISPQGLELDKEYFVRVRACAQEIADSDWSDTVSFYYEQEEIEIIPEEKKYIEVVNVDTLQVSTEIGAIEFKIYDQLTTSDLDNINISLIGNSIKDIPYIKSDGEVNGTLEIKEQTDTYTLIRYVI